VIDLAEGLAPEDRAVALVFGLTAASDLDPDEPEAVAAVLALALVGSLDFVDEEEDLEDMQNPCSEATPVAAPLRSLGLDGRRPTRWGRAHCAGFLAPGSSDVDRCRQVATMMAAMLRSRQLTSLCTRGVRPQPVCVVHHLRRSTLAQLHREPWPLLKLDSCFLCRH